MILCIVKNARLYTLDLDKVDGIRTVGLLCRNHHSSFAINSQCLTIIFYHFNLLKPFTAQIPSHIVHL